MKNKFSIAMSLAVILAMLVTSLALASGVDVSVVDVSVPLDSVTLAPDATGNITINLSVTGNQVGTATFEVYRDWTLSAGTFTGSNPQEFTVPPRAAGDPATTFSTSGTVKVAAGQTPGGPFTVTVGVFDITNTNSTGAKLSAGQSDTYSVTVSSPPPPSDTTAPSFDCTVPDQSVWYGSDVTVNCTASDSGSGLANASDAAFSLSTSVAPGTETASAATGSKQVCDTVGNCVTVGPYTFQVDKKAPSFSCGSADGVWHASDVSIACSASDGGSGLATPANFSLSTNVPANTEDANASTGTASLADNVGNNTTAGPISGNMVDKKSPTNISFVGGGITAGGEYYFGSVPAGPTGCTADDGGSGLASCNVTGGGTTVGAHSYTATATDNVGNSDTATLSYTVLAWTLNGFYAPVDMNNVINTVKGGSTVPLKFEVFAGSTELTAITTIKSFVQTKIACDTSATIDEIEVTSTGGTSLRYDTTAGQFIQNWQTPKAAGTCYRVTMTTLDGSSLVAFFKLK